MTTIDNEVPKGFQFFTGLCIFIGTVGLLVNGIFLLLSFAPTLPPGLKEAAPGFLLSTLHMVRNIGYIIGAKRSKERQSWAAKLLIACAATALLELIYNTTRSLHEAEISMSPVSISYLMIPLLLEGSIIYYFTRRSIQAYLTGEPLPK